MNSALLKAIPEFKKDKFLKKKYTAEKIAPYFDININTSPSFNHFISAIKNYT